jgi:exosortase
MENNSPFHKRAVVNLTLALEIATIAAAVLTVFHQDLTILINDALQSEFMSYILAVPFLFIYLIYRKRKMLAAVVAIENEHKPRQMRYLATIAGIILSSTAILLYWYGSYTFTPLEYHMFALPVFVAGLVLIFFNTQTFRQLIFPIVFLVFLIPPPLETLYSLGSTLSIISSEAAYTIISSLGIPSTLSSDFRNPVIQITGLNGSTMSFTVDIACSGIFSLIGFLIFAVFIAYIIRDKPWKKLALFLVGFSLIYLLNIARITTIILLGYFYGEEIALQLFHFLGGWTLIFIGTLVLLIFAERMLRTQIFAKPAQKCTACSKDSVGNQSFCHQCGKVLKSASIKLCTARISKIAIILVSIIMLVSIQVPVFALTEGPVQVIIQTPAGEQGNTKLLPQYIKEYTLASYVYRDKEFEKISGQDASLIYSYLPSDDTKKAISVAVEIASATSSLHGWEVCLIPAQGSVRVASVTQLGLRDIIILENPPIIARYFAFQWLETNQTQVVLYWFETSVFMINGTTTQQKHVKISLITYPDTPQNLPTAEDLLPFAETLVQYWQPLKTWSQIAIFLSQKSIYLAIMMNSLLLVITVLYILESKKQKIANAEAYQKLSTSNKRIIDAISETEKATTPTLNAIASTYKNRIGEPIENEELLQKFSDIEKTGIIRSELASIQDEPTKTWKTQISMRARLKVSLRSLLKP